MHQADALTYVVLDVPEPQASAVMSVRQAHNDLFRAALPVEITLSDSILPEQDPSEAFDALGTKPTSEIHPDGWRPSWSVYPGSRSVTWID